MMCRDNTYLMYLQNSPYYATFRLLPWSLGKAKTPVLSSFICSVDDDDDDDDDDDGIFLISRRVGPWDEQP